MKIIFSYHYTNVCGNGDEKTGGVFQKSFPDSEKNQAKFSKIQAGFGENPGGIFKNAGEVFENPSLIFGN